MFSFAESVLVAVFRSFYCSSILGRGKMPQPKNDCSQVSFRCSPFPGAAFRHQLYFNCNLFADRRGHKCRIVSPLGGNVMSKTEYVLALNKQLRGVCVYLSVPCCGCPMPCYAERWRRSILPGRCPSSAAPPGWEGPSPYAPLLGCRPKTAKKETEF